MNLSCAVALVLLLDTSGSIHKSEYELQRDGTAAAFESEEIGRVIDRAGGVAVTVVEFASRTRHVLPWRLITAREESRRFAADLRATERGISGSTATAIALDEAVRLFDTAPCEPDEKVIDVSTDGPPDNDQNVPAARDRAFAAGIKINGIGVFTHSTPVGEAPSDFMRKDLITPGGFAIDVTNWADFEQAIRRKLILELSAR